MNQDAFWSGGLPGENGTRNLYQMTHDDFTRTKGLSKPVWVWDMQDFGSLVNDLNNDTPGADRWDVAALVADEGFADWKNQAMVNISGGKPIAIGECGPLPTATVLANQPGCSLWELEADDTPANTNDNGLTPGTSYVVLAQHSGKALDVQGGTGATQDGAHVHQWDYQGQANQQWVLTAVGNGYYTLQARHSGKVLEVSAWSSGNGGNVQQWPYQGKANQQWRIENLDNGYYRIINRHSGKALHVSGGTGATQNGAHVHQWDYLGQSNQQWQFVPVR